MPSPLEVLVQQRSEEKILADIQSIEERINSAQQQFESVSMAKRSLEKTAKEVVSVGLDATALRREINTLALSLAKAAENFDQACRAAPEIQRLKEELRTAGNEFQGTGHAIVKTARPDALAVQRTKEESPRIKILEGLHSA